MLREINQSQKDKYCVIAWLNIYGYGLMSEKFKLGDKIKFILKCSKLRHHDEHKEKNWTYSANP